LEAPAEMGRGQREAEGRGVLAWKVSKEARGEGASLPLPFATPYSRVIAGDLAGGPLCGVAPN
jgi:hypothetical protein